MRVVLDIDGPNTALLTETEIERAVYTAWRDAQPGITGRRSGSGFMAYVRATVEER